MMQRHFHDAAKPPALLAEASIASRENAGALAMAQEATMTNDSPTPTQLRAGFFPFVSGEHVEITQAGAVAVSAGGDLTLTQAGAQMARVHGNVHVEQGGIQTLLARGDVSVEQGGILVGAAKSVRVEDGFVGVAVGQHVELTNCRVLLTQQNAAVFGAVAGIVMAIVWRIIGR